MMWDNQWESLLQSTPDAQLLFSEADQLLHSEITNRRPYTHWAPLEDKQLFLIIQQTKQHRTCIPWKEVVEKMPGVTIEQAKSRYSYTLKKLKKRATLLRNSILRRAGF